MALLLMCAAGAGLIFVTFLLLRVIWDVAGAVASVVIFFGVLLLCAAIGERVMGPPGAGVGLISALVSMAVWGWSRRRPRVTSRGFRHVEASRPPLPADPTGEAPPRSSVGHVAQRRKWRSRLLRRGDEPDHDERWNVAWLRIQTEADWAAVRISLARRSCERLLASADQPGHEVATAIRRGIPNAVNSGLAEIQGLSTGQRQDRLEKLVEVLEAYAALAERCQSDGLKSEGSQLDIHLAHIANLEARRK